MKKLMKGLSGVLLAAVLLAVVAVIVICVIYRGELRTLNSIRRMEDDSFFTMEYHADYGLDEFLEVGASSDGELKDFIIKRLLRGLPLDFELPELGCSTFAAKLSDGSSVFGRNFDEIACPSMMVITRPKNGYDSISMVNLSYIGFSEEKLPVKFADSLFALAAPYAPLDGVNEKGLTAGMLFIAAPSTNQDTGKVDITTTSAVRMILDRCATVGEAVELLSKYDMHASAGGCFHFHIADARGGSVVVEYVNNEMKVVEEHAATNFLFNPVPGVREIGRDRYDKMKRALERNGGVFEDMEAAMHLLHVVAQDGGPDQRAGTRWSSVYNQTKPSLLLAVNRDYDNLYEFTLE